MNSIKLQVDAWINQEGAVHLTSNDPRLGKEGINIECKRGLASTERLQRAIEEAARE